MPGFLEAQVYSRLAPRRDKDDGLFFLACSTNIYIRIYILLGDKNRHKTKSFADYTAKHGRTPSGRDSVQRQRRRQSPRKCADSGSSCGSPTSPGGRTLSQPPGRRTVFTEWRCSSGNGTRPHPASSSCSAAAATVSSSSHAATPGPAPATPADAIHPDASTRHAPSSYAEPGHAGTSATPSGGAHTQTRRGN